MYNYSKDKKELLETAKWNNYIVRKDGCIMDASGKEKYIDKFGKVKVILNGKVTFRFAKCIVYEAFTGNSSRKVVIELKKPGYYGLDNLIITPRTTYCSVHSSCRKLSREQEENIRREREKPFKMTQKNGMIKHYKKTSMNYLAKKYGVSYSTIYHILNPKENVSDKEALCDE